MMTSKTNSRYRIALLLGVIGLFSPLFAMADKVEETDWLKQKDGLIVQLFFVPDQQALLKSWSSRTEELKIEVINSVKRGEPLTAALLFTGCAEDKQGNCNLKVDYTVHYPDGSVLAEHKNTDLWVGMPAPAKDIYELGRAFMSLAFEESDPKGTYVIHAVVNDMNNKNKILLKREFTVH